MTSEHIAEDFKDEEGVPIGEGGGPDEYIFKLADESVANSTALQDDNELKFTVAAGEKWTGFINIYYTGKDGGGGGGGEPSIDLKATVAVGSGTPDFAQFNPIGLQTIAFGLTSISTGSATLRIFAICFTLDNTAGDATEVRFRWAQNTADATPVVVKKGSTLMAWLQQ